MNHEPDYIVELGRRRDDRTVGNPSPEGAKRLRGRPWLAVYWKCCGAYSRIYRNAEGTLYEGRCPSCHKRTRARIGPEGEQTRFFEAG